ncbi:hypothetical protein Tco_0159769, partial [Tanacetum coccineum]
RHIGKEKVTLDDLFLLHSIDGEVQCLGIGEMVDEIPEVAGDDDVGAGQAEIGGVGRHPNMSTTNRLRAMDERLREIETGISQLVSDVDELTYVVSRMSEQYD